MMSGAESDFLNRLVVIFQDTMVDIGQASEKLKKDNYSEFFSKVASVRPHH